MMSHGHLVGVQAESEGGRISISGLLIGFLVVSLPLTMFQAGSLGSLQRWINIAVIPLGLAVLAGKRAPVRVTLVGWLALGYGLWLLASVLWSARGASSLTFALGMMLTIAVFLVLGSLPLTTGDLRLISAAWVVMALIAAALFVMFGEQARIGGRTHLVIISGGSDPNEFCAYFLLPLAIVVRGVVGSRGLRKLFYLASSGLFVYIILMTGSRTGLIASVVVVILVVFREREQGGAGARLRSALLGSAGVAIIGYFIWPLVPLAVQQRLSFEALLEDGGSSRDMIWLSGLDLIASSGIEVVTGFGVMAAPLDRNVMHNHYIQTLVDVGLVGLVLLILFTLCTLRFSWPNIPIFAGVVGVLITFMTLTAYSNYRQAWVVLFMAMLLAREDVIASWPRLRVRARSESNRLEMM